MSCCDHFTENFKCILNSDLVENVYSKYKLIEKSNENNGKVSEMDIMANISNFSFTLDKRIVDSNNKEINVFGFLNRRAEGLSKKNDLVVNSNGFDIPLLSWNYRARLPLRDIHSKVTCYS